MSGPLRLERGGLASVLPAESHIFVSACSAESDLFEDEIEAAGDVRKNISVSGVFVPGLNSQAWAGAGRVITFFQTPELKRRHDQTRFLPLCYQDITRWYEQNPPDVVMLMVAPPDQSGMCSLGVDCGFGGDLWRRAKIRIAQINPSMPRTAGDAGIPFNELTAYYDVAQDLRTLDPAPGDAASLRIAGLAASYIGDGACLQTGLGKLPDTILDTLHDRKNLRLHSGLAGDGALRLVRSGAMAEGAPALVGCAIGSSDLYAGATSPQFQFRPVSVTHDVARLAQISGLVTINSVMSVDLFGQGFAEASSRGFLSGPGGATDFARGARQSADGVRLIVLPSSAGEASRIVAPGGGVGPVSLSRFDIDVVITEHGAADLRSKDHHQRARTLIDIAAPQHREELDRAWAQIAVKI
ncbi:acetyl-CoA hydrolase/transferase family protein [Hyphomonas sp.]|uniref:acetyl-CoA hydrolase/transferase family protein n=1 Tax=Hyphomonas sp. TaxID=87 RepID=UPI003F6EE321